MLVESVNANGAVTWCDSPACYKKGDGSAD
jgi:hypothetical protein